MNLYLDRLALIGYKGGVAYLSHCPVPVSDHVKDQGIVGGSRRFDPLGSFELQFCQMLTQLIVSRSTILDILSQGDVDGTPLLLLFCLLFLGDAGPSRVELGLTGPLFPRVPQEGVPSLQLPRPC